MIVREGIQTQSRPPGAVRRAIPMKEVDEQACHGVRQDERDVDDALDGSSCVRDEIGKNVGKRRLRGSGGGPRSPCTERERIDLITSDDAATPRRLAGLASSAIVILASARTVIPTSSRRGYEPDGASIDILPLRLPPEEVTSSSPWRGLSSFGLHVECS